MPVTPALLCDVAGVLLPGVLLGDEPALLRPEERAESLEPPAGALVRPERASGGFAGLAALKRPSPLGRWTIPGAETALITAAAAAMAAPAAMTLAVMVFRLLFPPLLFWLFLLGPSSCGLLVLWPGGLRLLSNRWRTAADSGRRSSISWLALAAPMTASSSRARRTGGKRRGRSAPTRSCSGCS